MRLAFTARLLAGEVGEGWGRRAVGWGVAMVLATLAAGAVGSGVVWGGAVALHGGGGLGWWVGDGCFGVLCGAGAVWVVWYSRRLRRMADGLCVTCGGGMCAGAWVCPQCGAWVVERTEVTWLRKAAEVGVAAAQLKLGECYAAGEGVGEDLGEAARWFRRAAEQGERRAQYALGMCYYRGEGVEQEALEAERWLGKAAAQGDVGAVRALREIGGAMVSRGERAAPRATTAETRVPVNVAAAYGLDAAVVPS